MSPNPTDPIIPPVFCTAGCGEDITDHALPLRNGAYCALCGSILALDILDNPDSSEADKHRAREVLTIVDLRRQVEIREIQKRRGK